MGVRVSEGVCTRRIGSCGWCRRVEGDAFVLIITAFPLHGPLPRTELLRAMFIFFPFDEEDLENVELVRLGQSAILIYCPVVLNTMGWQGSIRV